MSVHPLRGKRHSGASSPGSSAADAPPPVRLTPTQSEAEAIRDYFERTRRCEIPSGESTDFADQLYVRNELIAFSRDRVFASAEERDRWVRHADKIIELARYAGIFASLRWLDRPEADLDERLDRCRQGRWP